MKGIGRSINLVCAYHHIVNLCKESPYVGTGGPLLGHAGDRGPTTLSLGTEAGFKLVETFSAPPLSRQAVALEPAQEKR